MNGIDDTTKDLLTLLLEQVDAAQAAQAAQMGDTWSDLPTTSLAHQDQPAQDHATHNSHASVAAMQHPAHTASASSASYADHLLELARESPDMARLRELLLVPERQRIAELEAEITSMQEQLRDNEALIALFAPLISHAIAYQIQESRDEMAEALYPVIGKSITRAVQEAIRDLARTIDNRMQQSLRSPRQIIQNLNWRLRGVDPDSGRLRDLIPFQVQEILLIHRETGLLIQHLSTINTLTDADIISGMLTAIRSYVQDSFGSTQQEGSLDAISYGNLRILIEDGSSAYLAVVLQGIEPSGFQSRMREQLSLLHGALGASLRSFSGDSLDEQRIAALLEPLMERQDGAA
jgi:OOP family OmpA-OmpF porin